MLSALAPVLIDRGLDLNDVLSDDGSFSDSQRQHNHRITEKRWGRQPKVKKIIGRGNLNEIWVENRKRGLKILELLVCWTY